MYNEVAVLNSCNDGRLLENIVYLQLKRKNKTPFYFNEKQECDFVIQEKNKVIAAVQVTTALNTGDREREIKGLSEATKKFNLHEGLIITLDETDEIIADDKCRILIKPIWQWLLEN